MINDIFLQIMELSSKRYNELFTRYNQGRQIASVHGDILMQNIWS